MTPALASASAVSPAATAALGFAIAGTLSGTELAAGKPDFALQTVVDVARLIAGAMGAPAVAAVGRLRRRHRYFLLDFTNPA